MLSPIFMVDLAVPQRRRSRMGSWLLSDSASAPRDCAVQMLAPAALFGFGAHVAALAEFAKQQPISNVSYAHTTRIAAGGGGALGSHPARDPV